MATVTPLLDVNDLSVERENRGVVRGVSFSAPRGELVAVMGPSGAGKTTVLRAIAGLEPRMSGTVVVRRPQTDVRDAARATASTPAVGMVFQFHHLFEHLTALQNVCLAPVHVARIARHDAERQAQTLLDRLGVAHRMHARPRELSGGEAQRVAIARALAMKPLLLLMDEPTASLDPARRDELAAIIRGLSNDGTTVLMSTHDAAFAAGCVDRVLWLDDGVITRAGRPAAVLS